MEDGIMSHEVYACDIYGKLKLSNFPATTFARRFAVGRDPVFPPTTFPTVEDREIADSFDVTKALKEAREERSKSV